MEWNRAGEDARPRIQMPQGDDTTWCQLQLADVVAGQSHLLSTWKHAGHASSPVSVTPDTVSCGHGILFLSHPGGRGLTFKRHGFTSDMIGTAVQWTYSSGLTTVHVYYCANFYCLTSPQGGVSKSPRPTGLYGDDEGLLLRRADLLHQNKGRHVPDQPDRAERRKADRAGSSSAATRCVFCKITRDSTRWAALAPPPHRRAISTPTS